MSEMQDRANRLIAFCSEVCWTLDEARGALGQALVTMLDRERDAKRPHDRYHHVLHTEDGHDLWLHETEPLIRFDMSEPPMMRRGVPLWWVESALFVAERARSILTADRKSLGLETKSARER